MEWTKNLKLAGNNYYSGVVDDVEDTLEDFICFLDGTGTSYHNIT